MDELRGLWRGKRVDTNAWITGDLMRGTDIIDCTEIAEHTGVGSRYDVIPETLGECTCLRDKNSTPIFEGDICTVAMANIADDEYGVVKYDEAAAVFIIDFGTYTINFCDNVNSSAVEIIGNIHDNP